MAVLPTPGSPISTGLFLVRRLSTCITRRISSSRPITGSSLPRARLLGEIDGVALQRLIFRFRILIGHALRAAHRDQRFQDGVVVGALLVQQAAGGIVFLVRRWRAADARSRRTRL